MAEVNQSSILIAGENMSMDDIRAKAEETRVQPENQNDGNDKGADNLATGSESENNLPQNQDLEENSEQFVGNFNIEQLVEGIKRDDEEFKLERRVNLLLKEHFDGDNPPLAEFTQLLDKVESRFKSDLQKVEKSDDSGKTEDVNKKIDNIRRLKYRISSIIQEQTKTMLLETEDIEVEKFKNQTLDTLAFLTSFQDHAELERLFLTGSQDDQLSWEELQNDKKLFSEHSAWFLSKYETTSHLLEVYLQIEDSVARQGLSEKWDSEKQASFFSSFKDMQKGVDDWSEGIPGVSDFISLIFAVDKSGFGYGDRLYRDGVEAKNDLEDTTMEFLKASMESEEDKKKFYLYLFKEEKKIEEINLQTEVRDLLSAPKKAEDPEEKVKLIEDIKERVAYAIKKNLEGKKSDLPDKKSINLSAEVVQYLLEQSVRVATKKED